MWSFLWELFCGVSPLWCIQNLKATAGRFRKILNLGEIFGYDLVPEGIGMFQALHFAVQHCIV